MSPQVPEAQYNLVILNVVYIWNDNYKQITEYKQIFMK